jgi:hypothetical protein
MQGFDLGQSYFILNSHITFLVSHKIHVNCHITIMAILELLPQPPLLGVAAAVAAAVAPAAGCMLGCMKPPV